MFETDGIVEDDGDGIQTITITDPNSQDIVEEEDLADGTHIRKEIHTENGVQRIRIT